MGWVVGRGGRGVGERLREEGGLPGSSNSSLNPIHVGSKSVLYPANLPYKLRHLSSSPPIWFADVFDKPLASCCPTEYLLSCCPSPITKPCNASVTAPPRMPQQSPKQSPNQDRWRKPFCMKPMNSSACEAGFYFNKLTRQVEPCPDGKIA